MLYVVITNKLEDYTYNMNYVIYASDKDDAYKKFVNMYPHVLEEYRVCSIEEITNNRIYLFTIEEMTMHSYYVKEELVCEYACRPCDKKGCTFTLRTFESKDLEDRFVSARFIKGEWTVVAAKYTYSPVHNKIFEGPRFRDIN